MTTILTLTPNPAIDISTSVAHIEPTRKLRCSSGRRDPGGGGVNVARVAHRLGADTLAIYPAGGHTGRVLEELIRAEGIRSAVVPIKGETREDFTVVDEETHDEYRFVLPGPHLSGVEWMDCLKTLAAVDKKPDFVCASGSLPPGAPDDFYARVAEIVESWGVKLALDTSGAALETALEQRVHLVKLNAGELCELAGAALDDERSLLESCRNLIARGRIEAVALTLGAEGALLVTHHQAWRAQPLAIEPVSSVGAGDSFVGAMVWALASAMPLEQAFGYGAAAGAAALLAHGTELCRASAIHRLLPDVIVEPIVERALA